jgi:hypothetical protein
MVMVCSEVDRSGAMAGNGMNYWRIVEGVCPSKEELTTRAVESSCDCWLSRAKLSESGFWNLDKSGNAEVQHVSILYPPWCALETPASISTAKQQRNRLSQLFLGILQRLRNKYCGSTSASVY